MKNKKFLGIMLLLAIVAIVVTEGILLVFSTMQKSVQTQSVAITKIKSTIAATGTIHSQNEATLHFQTGGKLVYLPFKQGDVISQGQTIAQLDTYQLQRELTAALNTYRSTRDQFDQTQQNANSSVTQNNQRGQLNFYGAGIGSYGTDNSATNYLNDIAKRI
ncbi:MAG: HlyD family efflux transporter periplasmic adaptor subunit, partial [Candidatus Levyibacteriota bacterium]